MLQWSVKHTTAVWVVSECFGARMSGYLLSQLAHMYIWWHHMLQWSGKHTTAEWMFWCRDVWALLIITTCTMTSYSYVHLADWVVSEAYTTAVWVVRECFGARCLAKASQMNLSLTSWVWSDHSYNQWISLSHVPNVDIISVKYTTAVWVVRECFGAGMSG